MGVGELEEAFRRAKAADRTTVIHIDIHPTDWTEGNGSWWECGTPEVSERASVRAARKEHEAGKANHRLFIWSVLSFEWWCRRFLDGAS